MRYRVLVMGFVLSLIPVILTLIITVNTDKYKPSYTAKIAVEVNQAQKLTDQGDSEQARKALDKIQPLLDEIKKDTADRTVIWMIGIFSAVIINLAFVYIWASVIRPFHKLEEYADDIASGDLDTPLDYKRGNYFGKFTWAFDNMRREIVKARAREREAIDNNKTVIASLSHDLKTPVASITAYSEALVNGLYSDTEEMYSYLEVINQKCEEVARLTNDMITHSIGELNALKMEPESIDLCELISKVVRETAADNIRFEEPMFPVRVLADRNRLAQLFGNLIGNAQKYAQTDIDITITKQDRFFDVSVRDYGGGIPDEDMAFIFDKFYRGSNSHDRNGTGLGLYIVRYIARQTGGDVQARNADPGLEVTVTIPEEKEK